MTSTPAEKISPAVLGVMPEPPAEFSPLAMTKSSACCSRNLGRRVLTALRPGCPTMSPMKSSFTGKFYRIGNEKQTTNGHESYQFPETFGTFSSVGRDARLARPAKVPPPTPVAPARRSYLL